MDFNHNVIQWLGTIILMQTVCCFEHMRHVKDIGMQREDALYWNKLEESNDYYALYHLEDDNLCKDASESYTTEILGRKYEKTLANRVLKLQKHLTPQQQKQLKDVLSKYSKLFDGKLDL